MFTLQTLPAAPDAPRLQVAESSGFSLHAGIAATASQPDKLEHLARYVARPPLATERLALTGSGQVRYTLKTPYRDGTTHVIFEPEDFIARLAALVPKPRAHLTRYHGVFAPASPDSPRRHVVCMRKRRAFSGAPLNVGVMCHSLAAAYVAPFSTVRRQRQWLIRLRKS